VPARPRPEGEKCFAARQPRTKTRESHLSTLSPYYCQRAVEGAIHPISSSFDGVTGNRAGTDHSTNDCVQHMPTNHVFIVQPSRLSRTVGSSISNKTPSVRAFREASSCRKENPVSLVLRPP
jgi:hypothetical protein